MNAAASPFGVAVRRLSVQAWFYIVVAVMVAIVALGSVIGASLLHQTNTASDRLITNIEPAQTAAYRLQSTLVDQETGVRGYALTADPEFLAPYTVGLQDEKDAAEQIRRLLPTDANVLADLDRLEAATARWREQFAEPLISNVVAGSGDSLNPAQVTRAKDAFDEIRGLFDAENATLSSLTQDSRDDLDRARQQRTWVLTAMVITFFVTVAVLLMLIRFLVLRPLELLKGSARRIAEGGFDEPIVPTGPGDLRELATAVENMRERIVGELNTAGPSARWWCSRLPTSTTSHRATPFQRRARAVRLRRIARSPGTSSQGRVLLPAAREALRRSARRTRPAVHRVRRRRSQANAGAHQRPPDLLPRRPGPRL